MRSKLFNMILSSSAMAAALTATTVFAATVNVPFAFDVAGRNCPAGTYSVEQNRFGNNFVTLRSEDARNSFTWVAGPGDANPSDQRIVLTFGELGQTHVLKSVQYHNMVKAGLDRNNRMSEQAPTRTVQGQ